MLELDPAYYASIMLVVFHAYYAQNYTGIIGTSLHKNRAQNCLSQIHRTY